MPELPEVETIRRGLEPLVRGLTLERVEVLDARWSKPRGPRALARALHGRRVLSLGRRGKYLVWQLSGDAHLVQHLRMTGAVLWRPGADQAHVRVRMQLAGDERGGELAIVDARRFGTGRLVVGARALEEFFAARLGVEPLDERFTAEHLRALRRGRRTPIKALLLDQRKIAGVGNIYADEALFGACIHPLRAADALSREQCERLRDALVAALRAGIAARGATIEDFRDVDGLSGAFQHELRVHRRAGQPCERCGTTIEKIRTAGRGTYVCETCQPRPRRRTRTTPSAAAQGAARAGRLRPGRRRRAS
jgi:formamidopyrimidine-DNA glycosylase